MTTAKQYGFLNRLTAISSQPSGTGVPPVSFNYSYNNASQRTQDKLADGSYWVYQYDSLGQVTSGIKYFYDGTPVPGQQFGYSFDTIGNRTQTKAGGDQRLANYWANNLNQITNRDYPGTNDIVGVALATNSVTVNGQPAWHKWEYFRGTVQTNNTAAPAWLSATVASGGTSNTGGLFMPKTPEHFSYDADGHLTNDGRWAYTWDAENRLIGMTANTTVGPQFQIEFAYDAKGRRMQQIASNGATVTTNDFVYDGWNLVAELQPNNRPIRTYVWGSDLSGSLQGAGGVGGLLEVSCYGASVTNCFAAYNGNGNLAALVNVSDGTNSANYEYGPFGEVIRSTGPMAKTNPIRFSTKYDDDESDLLYYGYRYYKPSTGTWVSRDSLTECGFDLLTTGHQASQNSSFSDADGDTPNLNDFLTTGGPNSYAFVDDDPVNEIDGTGLVIVAFYGADVWGSGETFGANPEIKNIAKYVGALGPYRSLDIMDPFMKLQQYFLSGKGSCSANNEPIKIFGHSWGAISAVKLSRWLGRSALRNHEIDVYTIDPVSLLRTRPISVPSSVNFFWNRYETKGGPVLGPLPLHGRALPTSARHNDQKEVDYDTDGTVLNHVTIVYAVELELVNLLQN